MPRKFKPSLVGNKRQIKIKRNDQVIVIAGKDKGKTGRVLRVIADKGRVMVEGVQMIKKHVKPNPQAGVKGGIVSQEATLHVSNVMLVDAEGKKTRIGAQGEGKEKQRIAKTTGAAIVTPKSK